MNRALFLLASRLAMIAIGSLLFSVRGSIAQIPTAPGATITIELDAEMRSCPEQVGYYYKPFCPYFRDPESADSEWKPWRDYINGFSFEVGIRQVLELRLIHGRSGHEMLIDRESQVWELVRVVRKEKIKTALDQLEGRWDVRSTLDEEGGKLVPSKFATSFFFNRQFSRIVAKLGTRAKGESPAAEKPIKFEINTYDGSLKVAEIHGGNSYLLYGLEPEYRKQIAGINGYEIVNGELHLKRDGTVQLIAEKAASLEDPPDPFSKDCLAMATQLLNLYGEGLPFGRCESKSFPVEGTSKVITRVFLIAGKVDFEWEVLCNAPGTKCKRASGWFDNDGQFIDFIDPPIAADLDPAVYTLGCDRFHARYGTQRATTEEIKTTSKVIYRAGKYWWQTDYRDEPSPKYSPEPNPNCKVTGRSIMGKYEAYTDVKAKYLFDLDNCSGFLIPECTTARALRAKSMELCRWLPEGRKSTTGRPILADLHESDVVPRCIENFLMRAANQTTIDAARKAGVGPWRGILVKPLSAFPKY